MLTRLSDNLFNLEHHAGLNKLRRWITKSRGSKYNFTLTAHCEVRTKA